MTMRTIEQNLLIGNESNFSDPSRILYSFLYIVFGAGKEPETLVCLANQ